MFRIDEIQLIIHFRLNYKLCSLLLIFKLTTISLSLAIYGNIFRYESRLYNRKRCKTFDHMEIN